MRSSCPITCALDLLGDRWTLVVLRDVLLAKRRHFSEIAKSEGIATNTLTERLERLESAGIVTRETDPEDGRKRIYTPTERGRTLIPILMELLLWGYDHAGGTARKDLVERYRKNKKAVLAELQDRI